MTRKRSAGEQTAAVRQSRYLEKLAKDGAKPVTVVLQKPALEALARATKAGITKAQAMNAAMECYWPPSKGGWRL